jgi:hypothetical protein
MTTLDRVPTQHAPPPEATAEAVASLRAGAPFTYVLADDAEERAALLQSVIDTAADMETRFVHVGNPLRAPLTIERLFMQTVGPEADIRLEREGAALTRTLATPVGDESRLVVLVQQAETLDKEALQTLHAMAPSFGTVAPRVQFVFCAPTALRALVSEATGPVEPPAPKRDAAPAAPPAPIAPEPVPAPPRRRRKWPGFAAALLLLAAAAAFAWSTQPHLLARLGRVAPHPTAAPAPPLAADPAPPTANPVEEAGMLRREFDVFIAARPDAAGLTDAQKDQLFTEFLDRRRARPQ